ncbi:hypothetical protein VE01_07080 [Pseudogymnoascus verrucosus]|uniref:amidase n=1 Tax=Pseudogymnoascus verrucosus TaxID=342668 RepID=A0A1B8GE11_9PEZI|nr:uncharacterized protein VE01_07080 [Pseudogymnoascus verrucosus]OBT94072.1 hypothetical protein VE01_07080 [Pseudogymnoascus verrucosus]
MAQTQERRPWQDIAQEEQNKRDAAIPSEWRLQNPPGPEVRNVMRVPYESGIMTAEELAWTEKDATELLRLISEGKLKSYDLTLAFCKRAAIAQQVLNCMTHIFFDDGLRQAKELDEIYAHTGKVVGPWHGLPFSIKDHFDIKGKDTSSGYVAWVGTIAEKDAPIVKLLRDAGAVFYCKTNNPQTLMQLETVSNLFGRTLNPHSRNLSPGGSSGGEAALVAFHGSPIGLAADGGGSIRAPAANVGLHGMKATSCRIPLAGSNFPMKGCEAFPEVVGVICKTTRDTEYFMRNVLDTQPWRNQPDMVPLPWRGAPTPKKITIGFFEDDGFVRPHPPITAALKAIVKKLRENPLFELREWKPYQHSRGYNVIRKLYFQDGGADNLEAMKASGEPILPLAAQSIIGPHTKLRTISESWALNVEREEYRTEYLQDWNQHPDIDFLLCPVGPCAASRHDTARYWGYTCVFNCLDYPAYSFPTGLKCSPESHPKDEIYTPRNDMDAYNWANYEPSEYMGAPINLQLVGKKWNCEKVIRAVDLIQACLGVE